MPLYPSSAVPEIANLQTTETDTDLVLHPDGAGGVEWAADATGGAGGALVDFAVIRYTAGDITCDADSVWEDLAGVGDLTLTAASGDFIEVGVSFQAANTTNISVSFDVGTIVSAAVVNHLSSGAAPDNAVFGVSGWRIPAAAQTSVGGAIAYVLQSGDITGGTVVLRLRDRVEGSTDRAINASTTRALHFWAKNYGQ